MSAPMSLPVSVERSGNTFRIVEGDSFILATMEDGLPSVNESQSAFICKAVNNHEALVAALREMTDLAERYGVGADCDGNLIAARQLIAEVEGGA